MRILITGANGLVGSHFVENYSNGLDNDLILTPNKDELDIVDRKSIENYFFQYQPAIVIHFAAFTDVSKAEEQRNDKDASCWMVNVEGTKNLVEACSKTNTYLVHISTDSVFSGHKNKPGPYDEDQPAEENLDLLSWYGWTKKEAEEIVKRDLEKSCIVRISNPVRSHYDAKLDYVRKILDLSDKNRLYPMFDNQYLTLTFIDEVSMTLKELLSRRLTGIFHVSSTNLFTPYKLANLLLEKARGKKGLVKPTSIELFLKDNPSRYPQYGGLKVDKTQSKLSIKFKKWEEIIDSLVKQLSI